MSDTKFHALDTLRSRDTRSLQLLAVLLAVDQSKADRCFVGGLEHPEETNSGFREWAHDWTRLLIVRNAVRVIVPWKQATSRNLCTAKAVKGCVPLDAWKLPISRVLGFPDFERFILVLACLGGYRDASVQGLITMPIESDL